MSPKGSVGNEDIFSGVPSTRKGMLVLAIVVNAVLLQVFGSSIFWTICPTQLLPLPVNYKITGL